MRFARGNHAATQRRIGRPTGRLSLDPPGGRRRSGLAVGEEVRLDERVERRLGNLAPLLRLEGPRSEDRRERPGALEDFLCGHDGGCAALCGDGSIER